MAKQRLENRAPIDVLVLGSHPSAYLAAALLRQKPKLRILHAIIPGQQIADHAVLVNPAFFQLDKLLSPLKRNVKLWPLHGVQFLGAEAHTSAQHISQSPLVYGASFKQIHDELVKIAAKQGVEFVSPKSVEIRHIDETGLEIALGKTVIHPKVLVLAGQLSDPQQRMLGLPETWGPDVVQRYTYVKIPADKATAAKGVLPMSLDLAGRLFWGWLMPLEGQVQLAVAQPIESVGTFKPLDLLGLWASTLGKHQILNSDVSGMLAHAGSVDLPMAGALAHEGLANRTLLVGPAGGFYSASGEDIYPNCWSAIYAAEAIHQAINERFVQDALHPYRQQWRTTLGNYLRGPQQNLRFLLPLIYRNPVMTQRLAEAILLGKGMIR